MSTVFENLPDGFSVLAYIPKSREYYARLDEFEGPLDILLHFIKEDEIDIFNIPISKITKDYLGYIEYTQSLDIELAGEFLLMAAELMKIKARMLLPQITLEGDEIEEDPRLTLVKKLLEYKRFKEATANLSELEQSAKTNYVRGNNSNDYREFESNDEIDPSLKNLTILNLIKAYHTVVKGIKREIVHSIETLDITAETKRLELIEYFGSGKEVEFNTFVSGINRRLEFVCTFLAVLQLALEGFLEIIVDNQDRSLFIIRKRLEANGEI